MSNMDDLDWQTKDGYPPSDSNAPAVFGGAAPLDLDQYQDPAWVLPREVAGNGPAPAPQNFTMAKRPAGILATRTRMGQLDIPAGASLKIGAVDDAAVRRRLVRLLKNSTPGYVRIGHTDSAAQLGYELDAPTTADHGAPTELMGAGPLYAFNTHATQTQTVAYVVEYVESSTGPYSDTDAPDPTVTVAGALDRMTSGLGKLIDLLSPFHGTEHDNDGAGSAGVPGVNTGGK